MSFHSPVSPQSLKVRPVMRMELLLLLLLSVLGGVQSKLFVQPYRLRELFYLEETVVSVLETAASLDTTMPTVQQYLERFKCRREDVPILLDLSKEEEHLAKIMEVLVGNPLHVYSLINRFVEFLFPARQELANHPRLGALERAIFSVLRQGEYPSQVDLTGVILAVCRVQFTYRLDPLLLAQGDILGFKTRARLDYSDLLKVAENRYSGTQPSRPGLGREFALAYEWAEAALVLLRREKTPKPEAETRILHFLDRVGTDHDASWKPGTDSPGNLPNEEFFISKIGSLNGRELREKEWKDLEDRYLPNRDVYGAYYHHDFYSLCRGEKMNINRSRAAEEKCYYSRGEGNLYFTLAPLKLEVLSENPSLYVYHEVLTPVEISLMKHYVTAQLNVAEIQDVTKIDGTGAKITTERTQSSGWLWDYQFPFLYNLSKKVEKMTGLKVARPVNNPITHIIEAEAWQVGVYGPGGHYLPHYDTFDVLDPSSSTPQGTWVGNRISTVMFYLSDVVGGATAFPKLGVAARPKAGSVVFWNNLNPSGERNLLSLHGACPTALGIKWVSNKWVREGAQVWTRPCSVNQ